MVQTKIFTRTYSSSSPRGLVSGKGAHGSKLKEPTLLREFRQHSQRWSKEPTALVSVSSRIIDTLQRSLDMYFEGSEPPENIIIAFIEFKANEDGPCHAAQELAEKCGLLNAAAYQYEYIFEWAIPKRCVTHQVSLQTLFSRGLGTSQFASLSQQAANTATLRSNIADEIKPIGHGNKAWEIGISLGFFAKTFGANAPVEWIAHRLFDDCIRACVDFDGITFHYGNAASDEFRWGNFEDLEDGITTALFDWWLKDPDCFLQFMKFEEWCDWKEQIIMEDHVDAYRNELCDEKRAALPEKHERIRMAIEQRSIELGL